MANLPRLIIGTAGHVDHGKTELIRALTGINADRWREEQERGMTIDLGFAYLDLPADGRAAIVDVPGHERFIHNMLAGATGIDLVLLVVAADEGVMPQTREHVAILDLLGVSHGIVVVTKVDRADADMLEIVREDVRDLLAPTGLAGSPEVVTSARTGQGIEDLVRAIDEAADRVEPHDVDGPARMPLDRSFTIGGHGTVVTGSLLRGRLKVGQQVAIIPAGLETRVRRLEVHGDFVDEIAAPARVGANLADVARDSLHRGDQLVEPGTMPESWLLDVELRLLPDARRPLRQRAPIWVHLLTAEASGRATLLDGREALAPGETAVAQVRLDRRVACAAGDRFVVRAYSPPTTVGGGVILDPAPRRHRTGRGEVLSALEALRSGSPARKVEEMVRQRGRSGATTDEVRLHLQLTAEQTDAILRYAVEAGLVAWIGDRWVSGEERERLAAQIGGALADYHRRQPMRQVMPTRDLQSATGLPLAALQAMVKAMAEEGLVVADRGGVRLAEHAPALSGETRKLVEGALAKILAAGLQPPARAAALETLGGGDAAPGLLDFLLGEGELVAVGEHVYAPQALAEAQEVLRQHFAGRGFTVADARDALGSTRKYIVPLLEHFDRTGFTSRRGDERQLRS